MLSQRIPRPIPKNTEEAEIQSLFAPGRQVEAHAGDDGLLR